MITKQELEQRMEPLSREAAELHYWLGCHGRDEGVERRLAEIYDTKLRILGDYFQTTKPGETQ